MVARLPARIVFRLRGWNDLSFQLNVGHVFNMTRGHYGQHHHKTLPGLKFIPTLSYFSS